MPTDNDLSRETKRVSNGSNSTPNSLKYNYPTVKLVLKFLFLNLPNFQTVKLTKINFEIITIYFDQGYDCFQRPIFNFFLEIKF